MICFNIPLKVVSNERNQHAPKNSSKSFYLCPSLLSEHKFSSLCLSPPTQNTSFSCASPQIDRDCCRFSVTAFAQLTFILLVKTSETFPRTACVGLSREVNAEGLLTVLKQRLVVCEFTVLNRWVCQQPLTFCTGNYKRKSLRSKGWNFWFAETFVILLTQTPGERLTFKGNQGEENATDTHVVLPLWGFVLTEFSPAPDSKPPESLIFSLTWSDPIFSTSAMILLYLFIFILSGIYNCVNVKIFLTNYCLGWLSPFGICFGCKQCRVIQDVLKESYWIAALDTSVLHHWRPDLNYTQLDPAQEDQGNVSNSWGSRKPPHVPWWPPTAVPWNSPLPDHHLLAWQELRTPSGREWTGMQSAAADWSRHLWQTSIPRGARPQQPSDQQNGLGLETERMATIAWCFFFARSG